MNKNKIIFRSRKTSITTGIVDRSEPIKQESVDRLSPLTNTSSGWSEVSVDFEKFIEVESDNSGTRSNEVKIFKLFLNN